MSRPKYSVPGSRTTCSHFAMIGFQFGMDKCLGIRTIEALLISEVSLSHDTEVYRYGLLLSTRLDNRQDQV